VNLVAALSLYSPGLQSRGGSDATTTVTITTTTTTTTTATIITFTIAATQLPASFTAATVADSREVASFYCRLPDYLSNRPMWLITH
jgi:hypothetical protein